MKVLPIVFLCCTLITSALFANIAAPPQPWPGNLVGENHLQNIAVQSERLTIIIPENSRENVKIRASYKISSEEPIEDLELVFVANNLTESKYLVKVDNKFVNGRLHPLDSIPNTWLPPDSIVFKTKIIPYKYTHKGLISFKIDKVLDGVHDLEVSYEAKLSEWFDRDDLAITSTFVYILKPEKEWKAFNDLFIEVFMPDNWDYTTNLKMKQHAPHVINGFWPELPAHHFAISLKPKEQHVELKSSLFVMISGLIATLLLIKWIAIVINFRIRKNKTKFLQTANTILVSFVGTVLFFVLFFNELAFKTYLLEGQINPYFNYGTGYFILSFPFLWIFIGLITVVISYILTNRIEQKINVEHYDSNR